MTDSDPFSGLPLSPSLADIDTDDLSLSRVISLALADTDDISQPALRALANFIATKISSLTNTEIARLSNDKITRLIDAELSRLSDDEIKCIIDSHISGFFGGIKDGILSFFASAVVSIFEDITPLFIKNNPDTALMIFHIFFYTGCGILGIIISSKIDKWTDQRATQRNQRATQRSLSRSPPPRPVVSRLPPPNAAQDLNSIGEIYSRGINPGFRQFCQLQEVQLHQKGTSRAVFPSIRSSGYRGWEPYSLLANSLSL